MNLAFACTVVYVKDVAKSVAFYAKAFGYAVRCLDESHQWGELASGQTTIAFTPLHQRETDDRTGVVHIPESRRDRPQIEFCFAYHAVDAAYKRAVESGALPVSEPEEKEWGQKVGFVHDLDGIVIRMGNHVQAPKQRLKSWNEICSIALIGSFLRFCMFLSPGRGADESFEFLKK